jgi:hypothetical protein
MTEPSQPFCLYITNVKWRLDQLTKIDIIQIVYCLFSLMTTRIEIVPLCNAIYLGHVNKGRPRLDIKSALFMSTRKHYNIQFHVFS